jgi:hypothetical protein
MIRDPRSTRDTSGGDLQEMREQVAVRTRMMTCLKAWPPSFVAAIVAASNRVDEHGLAIGGLPEDLGVQVDDAGATSSARAVCRNHDG